MPDGYNEPTSYEKGVNVSLSVTTTANDDKIVVAAQGEIDVSNASELRDPLDAALAEGAQQLVCDLSEVPYIDSTGIGVLVGVAHRAEEAGCSFVVAHPQHNVARVFGMLGVADELHIES